jgi:hypothetical protein
MKDMPLKPTPNVVVFHFVLSVTVTWWKRGFVMSAGDGGHVVKGRQMMHVVDGGET